MVWALKLAPATLRANTALNTINFLIIFGRFVSGFCFAFRAAKERKVNSKKKLSAYSYQTVHSLADLRPFRTGYPSYKTANKSGQKL
jgi:phage head maturation protease